MAVNGYEWAGNDQKWLGNDQEWPKWPEIVGNGPEWPETDGYS